MTFFEAYQQAVTLGRNVITPTGDKMTVMELDAMTLSVSQALSQNWDVAEPQTLSLTEEDLARAWNHAVAAGGFRSVSLASESPMFRHLKQQLFS